MLTLLLQIGDKMLNQYPAHVKDPKESDPTVPYLLLTLIKISNSPTVSCSSINKQGSEVNKLVTRTLILNFLLRLNFLGLLVLKILEVLLITLVPVLAPVIKLPVDHLNIMEIPRFRYKKIV